LFINHLPLETELVVWDLFFIKGIQVIFRVALTLFELMQADILEADDPGTIYMIVDKFGYKVDRKTLLQHIVGGISNAEIKLLRESNRVIVFETLK